MSKTTVFFTYMSTFTLLVIWGFLFLSGVDFSGMTFLRGELTFLSLFDRFIAEFCILLAAGMLLLGRNICLRVVLYLVSSLFIAIYLIQLITFYIGGEFLSRLAIDNLNHFSLLFNLLIGLGGAGLLLLCLALPLLVEKKKNEKHNCVNKRIGGALLLLIVAAMFQQSFLWLPQSIIAQRDEILGGHNSRLHTAPVSALWRVLFKDKQQFSYELSQVAFTPFELEEIEKFGFQYDPDSEFPLIRENIYSSPPPFQRTPGSSESPNIIVFFTEGFSARGMDTYRSQQLGLTPNLDGFAKGSMVVDNYYNHTAATYRGLSGQLCSFFPINGGGAGWQGRQKKILKISHYCLTDIFKSHGYETIFLDAHKKEEAYIDDMMVELGFGEVVNAEQLSERYLDNIAPYGDESLSDGQLFQGLVGLLEERAVNDKVDDPFFMGLYNLGTHAFQHLQKDGVSFGGSDNISLNTIHNFDSAFRLFWEYYKTSPFAKNTIIIFTADHCHYPERSFVGAFGDPGYQKKFIDKVPLIIYDPTHKLPKLFDARCATSIDFAPSLVHYLGLENRKNPFMGTSIYEENRKEYDSFGVSAFGNDLYLTTEGRIFQYQLSDNYLEKLQVLHKFINKCKELEVSNKLWCDKFN